MYEPIDFSESQYIHVATPSSQWLHVHFSKTLNHLLSTNFHSFLQPDMEEGGRLGLTSQALVFVYEYACRELSCYQPDSTCLGFGCYSKHVKILPLGNSENNYQWPFNHLLSPIII